MCGRFALTLNWSEIEKHYRLDKTVTPLNLAARYNIAPSQPALVVYREGLSNSATFMRWGLVPGWAPGIDSKFSMINARADTIDVKPAYRAAFRHRRCLVPASGFYEWQAVNGAKQPWYIRPKNQAPLSLAGLWEIWQGGEGSELLSFTLITTEANNDMRPIHDRMPVTLMPDDYDRWLDPLTAKADILPLLRPCADGDLEMWPIDRRVNSPSEDDPGLITTINRQAPKTG